MVRGNSLTTEYGWLLQLVRCYDEQIESFLVVQLEFLMTLLLEMRVVSLRGL